MSEVLTAELCGRSDRTRLESAVNDDRGRRRVIV